MLTAARLRRLASQWRQRRYQDMNCLEGAEKKQEETEQSFR